jgi:predicted metal-dependent hydrolase
MFSVFRSLRTATAPQTIAVRHDLPDLPWPVMFRKMKRARQLTLRLDQKKQHIVLSMPWRVGQREAHAFLQNHKDWLLSQMDRAPQPYLLEIGGMVPVLGIERVIRHIESDRRGVKVTLTDTELQVMGPVDRVPRALYRYLKDLARQHLSELAIEKAKIIDRPIKSLSFRDTSTRWGSCTSTGDLSFCWRLIMWWDMK